MTKNLNQLTADKLDRMKGLTEKSMDIIAGTDFNSLYEEFGRFDTVYEVNEYIDEYFSEGSDN